MADSHPADHERVLAWVTGGTLNTGHALAVFRTHDWVFGLGNVLPLSAVTHWMRLPGAPE